MSQIHISIVPFTSPTAKANGAMESAGVSPADHHDHEEPSGQQITELAPQKKVCTNCGKCGGACH